MAQTRKNIIILSVLYLLTRLLLLTEYPIFNDEAIYLREAWVMTHDPWNIWYALSDTGKQPLLFWIYGLVWQVVHDPLVAGRLVSVLIGMTTVWAAYLLGGSTAGILIVMAPMFVFFDRLALVDSALATIFAWLLVLLTKLQNHNALRTAVGAGLLVGVSFWIKSIGFLFALVIGFLFVYIWLARKRDFGIVIPLLVFVTIASWTAMPLFLRPEAARIFETAPLYTFSVKELIAQNFANVWQNSTQVFLDYAGYVSPFVVLTFLLSLRSVGKLKTRILLFAWLMTIGVIVVFGRGAHARYTLFTAVPVIVLSSSVLSTRKILLGVTVFIMAGLSALLLVNPPAFFHLFPFRELQGEAYGYVDGWPSGYGTKEALAAIDADRNGAPAVVAVRWDSGNPEDAMFVYTAGNRNYSFKYFDPKQPKDMNEVFTASLRMPVYFVTRQGQYNGLDRYLRPVGKFLKPDGKESVEVFRVQSI